MQTTNANRKVHQMYCKLPMVEACELHERLMQGKTDNETRHRLRNALRKTGLHRAREWQ